MIYKRTANEVYTVREMKQLTAENWHKRNARLYTRPCEKHDLLGI